jgi:uncharacterized protein (TIGR02646 family)
MRYININNLTIKNNKKWRKKAEKALVVARAKTTKAERSVYINSQSSIWAELKPSLEKLSNRKCWYCESYEKRSDRAVDHFRPKNNVRDSDPPHEGYWWLAFDPENYRLSCTYCNSRRSDRETHEVGGKGDYFPVYDEIKRVKPEGHNFKRENPLLLDPCNPSDVQLLWFKEDGRAVPKFDEANKPWAYRRAKESIKYYNLDEQEIKEARQAIYNRIKRLVENADMYFEEAFETNAPVSVAFENVLEELALLMNKDSEFSAFSRAIIAGFRGAPRPWLDSLDLINC